MGAGIGYVNLNTGGGGGPATELPATFITSAPGLTINDTGAAMSALSGSTGVLPGGEYLVTVSYLWNKGENAAADFVANLLVDGVSVTNWGGDMHRQQPVEVGGGDVNGTLTNQSIPASAMFNLTLTGSATHTYDFQFYGEFTDRVSVHGLTLAFQQFS